jgi:Tfp pilus assembly protein PilN
MASPNQLSFLPDDYLERKRSRRTNAIFASLFVVVVGSVFGAFTMTRKSLAALEGEYTAVDNQYAEAAKRIELVRQMQEKQRTMAGQAELTAGLLERVPRSHVLAEVTNAMPAGVSLLELDMQSRVRAVAVAPPRPAGTAGSITTADATRAAQDTARRAPEPRRYDVFMRLQGVAANDVQVAGFITRLGQSKLFRDVNLVISEEFKSEDTRGTGGAGVRKFTIELGLEPNARVLTDGTRVAEGATGTGSSQTATGPGSVRSDRATTRSIGGAK